MQKLFGYMIAPSLADMPLPGYPVQAKNLDSLGFRAPHFESIRFETIPKLIDRE
jgi:hypothetical protein